MTEQSDDLLNQIKERNDEWRKMIEETAEIEHFSSTDADGTVISTRKTTYKTATGTKSTTVTAMIPSSLIERCRRRIAREEGFDT